MKVANSYISLLKGVSQQVPSDRADGQHTEQVNMVSDPVNGLCRRHGSVWEAEKHIGLSAEDAVIPVYKADTAQWTSLDYDYGGKEYIVMYRRGTLPVGSTLPSIVVYNKTDKVFLTQSRNAVDAQLDLLHADGISAITAVGKYLFIAGHTVPVASTSTQVFSEQANNARAVVWIRGGAYGRTFKVTLRMADGTVYVASHTTPASSYQGVLDTSDIPSTATDYTKQVNDRVNAYNNAVTTWIGTAAAGIQPAAIAAALAVQITAVSGKAVTVVGSHICFDTDASAALRVASIEVNDGGDGSLATAVPAEIPSVDKVSPVHWNGKVVKVRAKNSEEAYYLKATAKDASATGFTDVTWAEGAGMVSAITSGLCLLTVVGTTFHIASTAALLTALVAGPHPSFSASTVGDGDSNPIPYFVGHKISYLGTFQNRLLIGSGGVLAVSKTDDYLNFFRSTVLTLPADDAFEMLPQGSEDDELRYGAVYDKSLIIFGKKRQYLISGDVAIAPTSANMAVVASYEQAVDAPPVSAGSFLFYAQSNGTSTSLHQMQPGLTENTPQSFPASSQVSTYLAGVPMDITAVTGTPSTLLVRTTGYRNGFYVFTYLDRQDGRVLDSWSRWEFAADLGHVIALSASQSGITVVSLREGVIPGTQAGRTMYLVADTIPIRTDLSGKPYLDSNRPWTQVAGVTGSVVPATTGSWAAAYDNTVAKRLSGASFGTASLTSLYTAYGTAGLVAGSEVPAYFVPTNPYMRDNKNKAILSGRLTVTKLLVAFKESVGFQWTVTLRGVEQATESFNGRIVGSANNILGIEPIETDQRGVPIGAETRQYSIKLAARRWYPLTLTAIEWVGQFFNRVQRF